MGARRDNQGGAPWGGGEFWVPAPHACPERRRSRRRSGRCWVFDWHKGLLREARGRRSVRAPRLSHKER